MAVARQPNTSHAGGAQFGGDRDGEERQRRRARPARAGGQRARRAAGCGAGQGRPARRGSDARPGLRPGAPPAVRVVAHPVQLALPRNRRRHRRERPQHRAGCRPVDRQRRARARRPHPRSVLRPGAPFARAGAARLPPCHRPRPLALSGPARPEAGPPGRPAGVVPRGRRQAVPARRQRVRLRLHPRQLVRLFRPAGGRPRRARVGQAGARLGRRPRHGPDGWRVDARAFRAALLGMGRPEPFRLPRARDGGGDRLISREVVVHAERGVIADQFYAERLYSRDRLEKLMLRAGFGNVRFHAVGTPDSPRNQDLGMFEHRLFVTGAAPHRPARLPRRAALFPEVTVLLGDPRLPDPVKRDGRFNEEDAETVARLKAALGELPGYRFRYLDNHATLFADLAAQRPDFVLNFCDEGFNNDAFLEMHVPALLEMLDIPYSGAGPACLGTCYNKSLVRGIAEAVDVPVPAETYFNSDDLAATIPSVFPALIKPNYGDSSIGITKDAVVHSWEE